MSRLMLDAVCVASTNKHPAPSFENEQFTMAYGVSSSRRNGKEGGMLLLKVMNNGHTKNP